MTPEEFWERGLPEPNCGCWLWTGGLYAKTGYGDVRVDGVRTSAHRMAWTLARGPIPEGLSVLHRCDMRRCIRPYHLFLGTPADNSLDMVIKGRAASGERNGRCRLTVSDVAEVLAAVDAGEEQRPLAARFGVAQTTISYAIRHRAA